MKNSWKEEDFSTIPVRKKKFSKERGRVPGNPTGEDQSEAIGEEIIVGRKTSSPTGEELGKVWTPSEDDLSKKHFNPLEATVRKMF